MADATARRSLIDPLARTHRRNARRRGRHGATAVRVLVPGDDLLQHRQAGHALAVHHEPRRRQPAMGAVRRRHGHRPADAGLHQGDRRRAAALDHSGDPGRHDRAARHLLGPVHPGRGRVGVGRLLPLRAHPRHPAHQPVLDPGQRHLRPAPGQAALWADRRRRQPGRRHRARPSPLRWSSRSAPRRCCSSAPPSWRCAW